MIVMLAEVSHSNSLDFIFQSTPHTVWFILDLVSVVNSRCVSG